MPMLHEFVVAKAPSGKDQLLKGELTENGRHILRSSIGSWRHCCYW
uniref:WPK1 n=1 Tax=Arundo donax TaxID=35708 RepID=A0A0A9EQW2_ARUDO